jgi:hypothetical protein
MKKCIKCLTQKEYNDFHRQKTSRDGFRNICKECRKSKDASYREKNRDRINEYMKEYSKDNFDRIKSKSDKWRIENRERYNQRGNNWKKSKKSWEKTNKDYKHIWRMFLHTTLRRMGTNKEMKTIDYLGYSPLDFKNRLEETFQEGMTWENYGEWHIDHIIPLSIFSKDESISVVNALTNLQALWSKDNIKKSNKIL